VELGPFLWVFDLEALEGVWVHHFDLDIQDYNSINVSQASVGEKEFDEEMKRGDGKREEGRGKREEGRGDEERG